MSEQEPGDSSAEPRPGDSVSRSRRSSASPWSSSGMLGGHGAAESDSCVRSVSWLVLAEVSGAAQLPAVSSELEQRVTLRETSSVSTQESSLSLASAASLPSS